METEKSWHQYLILNSHGDGLKKNSLQNVFLYLRFAKSDFGNFWMEGEEIHADRGKWRPEKEPGVMTETDYVALAGWLEYTGLEVSEKTLKKAVAAVAKWEEK